MKSGKNRIPIFIGRYSTHVGAKGRIAIPVKLREGLGTTAIISQGYEKSLLMFPKDQWATLTSFLVDKPMTLVPVRDTERFLFGSAYEAEFDDQGRIVVPRELREFADLNGEAVFLGVGNRIEIWSREHWENYEASMVGNIENIAAKITQNNEQ